MGVDDGNGGIMVVTISTTVRFVYMSGNAHQLSRAGCNRLLGWLFSNAELVRGWQDVGEYVFKVTEVQS
jgi:hypothetical protein